MGRMTLGLGVLWCGVVCRPTRVGRVGLMCFGWFLFSFLEVLRFCAVTKQQQKQKYEGSKLMVRYSKSVHRTLQITEQNCQINPPTQNLSDEIMQFFILLSAGS